MCVNQLQLLKAIAGGWLNSEIFIPFFLIVHLFNSLHMEHKLLLSLHDLNMGKEKSRHLF